MLIFPFTFHTKKKKQHKLNLYFQHDAGKTSSNIKSTTRGATGFTEIFDQAPVLREVGTLSKEFLGKTVLQDEITDHILGRQHCQMINGLCAPVHDNSKPNICRSVNFNILCIENSLYEHCTIKVKVTAR